MNSDLMSFKKFKLGKKSPSIIFGKRDRERVRE